MNVVTAFLNEHFKGIILLLATSFVNCNFQAYNSKIDYLYI
jgi:hypothetical protein